MRSRVLGAALFGLGILALVFAGGLAFVVAPTVERLPYDLKLTQSVAEAPGARFLQISKGVAQVNSGTLRSTVTVQPDVKATAALEDPLDGDTVVWLVGQDVIRTDTKVRVTAYSTSLALDRRTAAAKPWDGHWLDTGNNRQNVKYSGHMYKFPFGTERKTYQIFDRDILATRPANFVKTEQIEGLETYQFTQEIRDARQELPADRLQVLLSQLLPGATSGEVRYNNTRTVWVEPTTGQFIKVREQQNKSLVATDGRSTPILDAVFTYTDDTVARSADTARSNRQRLLLVGRYAPIGLTVLGLVLVVAGIVLATRRPRPAGARVPAQRQGAARHAVTVADGPAGDNTPATADPGRPARSGRNAD